MFDDRVVFYIDILGFTSFITSKEKDYNDVIEKSMGDIMKISNLFRSTGRDNIEVSTSIMSDSIVCSFIINRKHKNILNLTAILMACTAFQTSLLRSGILTRGALVRGELNHQDNMVYGSAMIDAYNLERNDAVFPRVILDDKIWYLIKGLNQNQIEQFITIDSDSKKYIDYISRLEEYDCNRDEVKNEIDSKYKETTGRVKEKYAWVRERL